MDCTDAVYSEDYYDLIVEYGGRPGALELSPCVQDVNNQYGIGYWERQGLPPFTIRNYTYTAIPKVFTLMDEGAMEASNILQIQNQPTLGLRGQGVLLGFIDTGIDYQNPVFQNSDGTTRIAAIWDQSLREGPPPLGFIYGTEYRKEQIDEALKLENPLRLVPTQDTNGHGTYVASLAAGTPSGENSFAGAAPYAQIAMVKLKQAKQYLRDFFFIREEAAAFQENDIMAGIAYLDQLAYELEMPLVLCITAGTNWGSHGGVSPLSSVLDSIVSKRMREGAIAAGNEANKQHHFYGKLEANGDTVDVNVNVGEQVSGFTLELWSSISEIFTVEIISPTGERMAPLGLHIFSQEFIFLFEDTKVTVEKNISFASNDYQVIFMRFEKPSQGIWNVRVHGVDILHGVFDMWLPVQELLDGEVYFIRSNPDMTITVPGNTLFPITVGGYDARNNSVYLDSGRGYTINGNIKPDIVAPAVEVIGAGLRNRFTTRTGTSASVAITSGAVALIMEWAIVKGNYPRITSGEIKSILIRGAARDGQRLYPNREWGYGRLDLYASFGALRSK